MLKKSFTYKFILSLVLLIIILLVGFYFFLNSKKEDKLFSESTDGIKAISSFNSNNPDQTISTVQNYLKSNPDDVSAKLVLASSYVQKGSVQFSEKENAEKALAVVNDVIVKDPNNVEAYRIKGYAYEIMQDYTNAFEAYNKALVINPSSAAVLSNRGHAYSLLGQNDNAEKDYKAALASNPKLDYALLNLGRLYVSENKLSDAEVYLKQVASTTENMRLKASAYQILGVAEISQSNFIQAKQYLDQSIEADPTLSTAYVERGRAIYFLLSKTSNKSDFTIGVNYILDNVQKASSINPNLTSSYLLGANVFELLDNKPQALVFYKKALAVVDQDISLSSTEKTSTKTDINAKIKLTK